MARDTTPQANEKARPAALAVPEGVRTGGTDPGHDSDDVPDQSPHDADKGTAARPRDSRADGTAGVDAEDAERVAREQSIGAEDRGKPD